MNALSALASAGPWLNGQRLAVDLRSLNLANPARIANANDQKWPPQRNRTFPERRDSCRVKMRLDAEIIVPDLPFIDTDPPGFNVLITVNRQRLRQPVMHPLILIFDRFFALNPSQRLGYGNGDERPGQLLRPAGAALQSLNDVATIIRAFVDQLSDNHQRDRQQ